MSKTQKRICPICKHLVTVDTRNRFVAHQTSMYDIADCAGSGLVPAHISPHGESAKHKRERGAS